MKAYNFKHWIDRHNNQVNENLLSWFSNLFKNKSQDQLGNKEYVIDPEEMARVSYKDPMVQKYTQEILRNLGISNNTKVDIVNHNNEKTGEWIINWSEDPQFIEALQRFIAAHIIGGDGNKSFLRINHQDAIIIINTLSQIRRINPRRSELTNIADELHIDNPKLLSIWIQARVPVANTASLQQGYEAASDEFNNEKFIRTGRGDPMTVPAVRRLADASLDTLKAWNKRKVAPKLYQALEKLDIVLAGLTGKERTEGNPIRKVGNKKNKTPTNDDDGVVGAGG